MMQTTDSDYTAHFRVDAEPASVYQALTTADGIAAWWTSWGSVTGSGGEGGELRFSFGGDDQLVIRVAAARPTAIAWSVQECAVMPDWADTRPTFTLHPGARGGTEIDFRHVGLTPSLECFGECRRSWDHYLAILQTHLANG